jgi:2-keto-4-pentenoate hydratase/2-oxohepta-3-ene-1,7-dioic acid hydratase in catechol pathway
VRFATFEAEGRVSIGVVVARGVVDLHELLPGGCRQTMLEALIDGFDELRGPIESLADAAPALPLEAVTLHAAVPAPGKVLCVMRNRPELAATPNPYAYLKYTGGAVGPGQPLRLPSHEVGLHHAPEVAAVIRGPARDVARGAWHTAVFGYTGFLDVVRPPSGLGPGEATDNWTKSWDTSCAIGPWVVTGDEVREPGAGLTLRLTTPSQTVESADPGRPALPELIEFLSSVMTLHTGDVIACGAHAAAVTPAVAGSRAELTVPEIGDLVVEVSA